MNKIKNYFLSIALDNKSYMLVELIACVLALILLLIGTPFTNVLACAVVAYMWFVFVADIVKSREEYREKFSHDISDEKYNKMHDSIESLISYMKERSPENTQYKKFLNKIFHWSIKYLNKKDKIPAGEPREKLDKIISELKEAIVRLNDIEK